MENNEIRIGEALETGFGLFKKQPRLWLQVVGVLFLVTLFPMLFRNMQHSDSQNLIAGLAFVLSTVVEIGVLRISLNAIDIRESSLSDLFSYIHLFLRFIAVLLIKIVSFGGPFVLYMKGFFPKPLLILILLVAILVWVRLGFADIYIVDVECGPLNALFFSWELTRGYLLKLLLVWLALSAVYIVGIIPAGLGLFVSIPVTYIARAYVFRKLQHLYEQETNGRKPTADSR